MNVDSNVLETPFDDMEALPPDVVRSPPPTLQPHPRGRDPHTRLLNAAFLSSRCPC